MTAAPAGAAGAAGTFTVSGFGDSSTGSCSAPDANGNSVCTTLRAAVTQASKQANSPTIELQAGAFQLTPGNGGQLDLASAMNILGAGPGGPSGTTIQQTDGQNRVLEVNGTTKLTGLEITGGDLAPGWQSGTTWLGGGILAQGALALQNVLITGNQVTAPAGPSPGDAGNGAEGGGIGYAGGAAAGSTITNTVITANKAVGGQGATGGSAPGGAGLGGGIAYEGTGALTVQGTTISQNAATGGAGGPAGGGNGGKGGAGNGGGIFNASDLTLEADTLSGNSATGGAQGAPASLSSFGGAGWGGGIFSQGASDEVVNSTVFGNVAQGGPAAAGGSPGNAYGGGIFAEGSGVSTTLDSDTIDANSSSQIGGNLGTATAYPFSIHDTILAGGSPSNCGLASPPTSESYNLEDDAADSCGFTGANHDLIGTSPQLASALLGNGGPTSTLAPATTSPVLRAGGTCLNPTSTPPNQPLSVDQRGEPRMTACDIGSFQAQSPKNVVAPVVSGTAIRGHRLFCSLGSWTGDGGPFTYAFVWLRNGVPIPGADTSTYVLGPADPGQSLACRVIATYYGSVAATSLFVTATSYPVITLLRVFGSASAVTVVLGCRGVDGQRCVGLLRLTVVERLRRGKVTALTAGGSQLRERTVTVGQQRYSLPARHTATVRVALKTAGSRLLKRFAGLPVKLTITQTTAAGTASVASRLLKLRRGRPVTRHR